MTLKRRVLIVAGGAVGLLASAVGVLPAPMAAADPPIVPFVPGAPGPLPATPGSYWYMYNVFPSVTPATVDARGIKRASNADTAGTTTGLPGSKMGNSPHIANYLTGASSRYDIAAGVMPAAPASTTGVQYAAGNEESPPIEDPYGRPPAAAAAATTAPVAPASVPGSPESAAPATFFPSAPALPALESPDGKSPDAATPAPAG